MSSPETNKPVQVWAIVPAAGVGRRMGTPKQCLPWGGTTVAGAVVAQLLRTDCNGIVVVTRSELIDALRLPRDTRILTACNDDLESEMIDSVRIGLAVLAGDTPPAATPFVTSPPMEDEVREAPATTGPEALDVAALDPCDGVLVIPADHPEVPAPTHQQCIDVYRAYPGSIVIACCGGQRGHPLIFPFSDRAIVAQLSFGLNELPTRLDDRLRLVETQQPATIQDLDTPEQYRDRAPGPPGL